MARKDWKSFSEAADIVISADSEVYVGFENEGLFGLDAEHQTRWRRPMPLMPKWQYSDVRAFALDRAGNAVVAATGAIAYVDLSQVDD